MAEDKSDKKTVDLVDYVDGFSVPNLNRMNTIAAGIRSAYDGRQTEYSIKTGVFFDPEIEPSMTHQSFKDECDINIIIAKYQNGLQVEHLAKYNGQYGDFANVVDYQQALNLVMEAEENFMDLPAKIRDRFNHDPAEFLAFVNNATAEELIEVGLAEKHYFQPVPDVKSDVDPSVNVTTSPKEENK